MSVVPVVLSEQEAAALARYIDKHGIPYGPDDGLIEAVRNRLPEQDKFRGGG